MSKGARCKKDSDDTDDVEAAPTMEEVSIEKVSNTHIEDDEDGSGYGFKDASIGKRNSDGEGDDDPETESNETNRLPGMSDEEEGDGPEDTPFKKQNYAK